MRLSKYADDVAMVSSDQKTGEMAVGKVKPVRD